MTNHLLAEHLSQEIIGEFQPEPFYEKETDSLIYYARDERSYAERVDEHFTVFRSVADDSVVGCEISGITNDGGKK